MARRATVPAVRDAPNHLFIGNDIAKFTDVHTTFTGMVKALNECKGSEWDASCSLELHRGDKEHQECDDTIGLAKSC
eukprot:3542092-Karenia_brevis.AAC.1